MKRYYVFLCRLAIGFLLMGMAQVFSSCLRLDRIYPSGYVVSKTHSVQPIRRICVGTAFVLHLSKGAKESVRIEADDNLMPHIEYTQRGGDIYCCLRSECVLSGYGTLHVYVTCTDELQEVELRGASHAYFEDTVALKNDLLLRLSGASVCEGNVKCNKFSVEENGASRSYLNFWANTAQLRLSGASKWEGQLFASSAHVESSGASYMHMNGVIPDLFLLFSGASKFEGLGLQTQKTDADLSGCSDVKCAVEKELRLKASGASVFTYRGDPKMVDLQLTGGSVLRRG